MAGRPLRRARLQAEEYQRNLALRGGEEPMQNVDHYATTYPPPPVRHPRITKAMREPAPLPASPRQARPMPAPLPSPPPLTDADAAIFTKARSKALQLAYDFLEMDVDAEYDATIRAKLILKRMEVAQNILALGGRIDPAGLRGAVGDEIGDMLASIKGGKA